MGDRVGEASMEPPDDGRSDGSRKSSLLTCRYAARCEQSPHGDTFSFLCGVVKDRIRPLTWARALPGIWLRTGALARSDDDCIGDWQSFMMADEEELAGIPSPA